MSLLETHLTQLVLADVLDVAGGSVQPGAALSLQISWVQPPDTSPDSVEKRARSLTENLGLSVLNRRLSALSRSANPPATWKAMSDESTEWALPSTRVTRMSTTG